MLLAISKLDIFGSIASTAPYKTQWDAKNLAKFAPSIYHTQAPLSMLVLSRMSSSIFEYLQSQNQAVLNNLYGRESAEGAGAFRRMCRRPSWPRQCSELDSGGQELCYAADLHGGGHDVFGDGGLDDWRCSAASTSLCFLS